MKRIIYCSILLIIAINLHGQDDPYEIEKYAFINYSLNQIIVSNPEYYKPLFEKFTEIGLKGEGKISIVHIGDSHLQADFLSGAFRKKLQTFFIGAMGGRGFIFPYKVAQTNNPLNYKVSSQGQWESCRCVEKNKNCKLGLSGISVSTSDKNAFLTVSIDDPKLPGYDFDRLMVFHEFGNQTLIPSIEQAKATNKFPEKGYTLFEFDENIASVKIQLKKTDSLQRKFSLYGLNFDSNDPGIIYHTIGVNGAQIESYLRCQYFVPHLQALQPDWVIVSLGTNDAYTHNFDTLGFKNKVDSIIDFIGQAAPNAVIMFTTPGDHLMAKTEINSNVEIASKILIDKAKQKQLSYWDFYNIMGGKGSINYWQYEGLAHTDYLHYSQKGYQYQAQLLFNAFLQGYDNYFASEFQLKK